MKTVMIVDDDRLARMGLIHAVDWSAYKMRVVYDTANGEAALTYAREQHVDLAFIDLEMPGMFGLELLRRLSSVSPETKCAIVTMHDDFKYIQEALRIGILDYIIKTELGGKQLVHVIERLSHRIEDFQDKTAFGGNDFGNKEFSYEIRHCIKKAVEMIEDEKGNYLTATEVSSRVNMSRSYFSTCFKQLVGMTFNEYFRKVRMENAKAELINSEKSIHDIASDNGFSDESYFSTVFKNYSGMPPTEYRRRNT